MDIPKFLESLTDEEKNQLKKVLVGIIKEENKERFLIEDFIDVMKIRIKFDKYPSFPYTEMSSRLCSCLQASLHYREGEYLDEIEPYLIKLRNMGKKSVEEYCLLKPEFLYLIKQIKELNLH